MYLWLFTFYTLVDVKSILFLGVALDIIICRCREATEGENSIGITAILVSPSVFCLRQNPPPSSDGGGASASHELTDKPQFKRTTQENREGKSFAIIYY